MIVDDTPELTNGRSLPPAPVADLNGIPASPSQWLPAVSTSRHALDDRQGWYQRTLAAELRTTEGINVIHLAVKNYSPEERQQTRTFTRHALQRSMDRVRPLALPADTYTWTEPTWSVMVKRNGRVVTHAGTIYRVVQAGPLRVPVGGIGGMMTLPEWRGRGYARAALAGATAFIGTQLWAPFAMIICPKANVGFYVHRGWSVAEGAVQCEQPGGRVNLHDEVAVILACQGDVAWPGGPIDVLGLPW